jgi:DnaK suppressor protein
MPLTKQQRHHLADRLQEERNLVIKNLSEFKASTNEDMQDRSSDLSKFPTHAADLGTDAQDENLDALIATRQSAELLQIDDAIERLAATPSSFGICENTGEEIPFARLDIIPWARTTVDSATA